MTDRIKFLVTGLILGMALVSGAGLLAQVDEFPGNRSVVVDGPANDATAVTEDDDTPFADMSRGLFIGTGGDVTVTTREGSVVEFVNVPDAYVLPVRASHLMEASTASDVVNLHD